MYDIIPVRVICICERELNPIPNHKFWERLERGCSSCSSTFHFKWDNKTNKYELAGIEDRNKTVKAIKEKDDNYIRIVAKMWGIEK